MRIAVISDVHADLHALEDALAQAELLGCERVLCCGDLVDYGLFPEETLALLRERAVLCIRGNHDRWAVRRGELPARDVLYLAGLPPIWDGMLAGTRVGLRHGSPRSDMEGLDPSAADSVAVRRWLDDVSADVLLVGHTHLAFAWTTASGRLVANPGALLRDPAVRREGVASLFDPEIGRFVPGPAPGGGTFGVLDLPERRFTVHRASDSAAVDIPRFG